MNCVFVQIRCKPGTAYTVADEIAAHDFYAELHSTSGEWDLLMKMYVPKDVDIGRHINDNLLGIANIERTLTTLTFRTV